MQHLILPIDDMKLTAGYKNPAYHSRFGFIHYGVDCVSRAGVRTVRACGDGVVVAAGLDGQTATGPSARMGRCIVVRYPAVACADGKTRDLACRMYHFDRLEVTVGQSVTAKTVLGNYGATGANVTGAHLHIEFDADAKWPCYAFGVAGGNIIKRGTTASTLSPAEVWRVGEGQRLTGSNDAYTAVVDLACPALPDETDYKALYEEVLTKLDKIHTLSAAE